jgi:hypothetical protein
MPDPFTNPPSVVRAAEDVSELLAAAKAEHDAGVRAERTSLEHYRKAGEVLARAKAAAGHGKWLSLLKERTGISQQRASEYMRLAAGWSKLPPGGDFTLKGAITLLAAEERKTDKQASLEEALREYHTHHWAFLGAHRQYLIDLERMAYAMADLRAKASDEVFQAAVAEAEIDPGDVEPLLELAAFWRRHTHLSPGRMSLKDLEASGQNWLDSLLRKAGLDLDA